MHPLGYQHRANKGSMVTPVLGTQDVRLGMGNCSVKYTIDMHCLFNYNFISVKCFQIQKSKLFNEYFCQSQCLGDFVISQ